MNEQKFYNIVKQYEKLVFSYCMSFVKDYQEAENLMQDTFFSFYKAADTMKENNYKAYIMKIAANKCKDFLKSAYNRKMVITEDEYFKSQCDNTSDVSKEIIMREEYSLIISCINKLNEPYKTIANDFYINGKSIDKITTDLNMPKKSVQTRLYRARDKLKLLLKEEL